ncbi:MAG: DNA polymerase III subunit delta' [Betaproteobacteria bacterium]|nr:DNA polymerase III subunit delta' [Betaproteobacteria bacterium]
MSIDILPWHRAALTELLARRETLPHAMLVYGRQGIGKIEFARAMAQSLLCESPESGIACGKCPACGWFREGNHPDFRELLPESMSDDDIDTDAPVDPEAKEKKKSKEIKIEQIRDIAAFMTLTTHRAGFRVLLVHPAEAMNPAAANALLKTLEEPPPHTVILLVTDRIGRLLATIRSRCQRLMVPSPDEATALQWLKAQGIADAPTALAQAGGAPLDAIAFADNNYQAERIAFVRVLSDSNADYLAAAQAFEKADPVSVLTWLQTWVSDLVLSRFTGDVRHHRDQKTALSRIATRVNLPALFRYESQLRQARRSIHHPLNARLLLEQLLISYSNAIR